MNWQILAVDRNFKISQNDINKSFDQLTKKNSSRCDTEMVHEVQPFSAERESESEGKGGLES